MIPDRVFAEYDTEVTKPQAKSDYDFLVVLRLFSAELLVGESLTLRRSHATALQQQQQKPQPKINILGYLKNWQKAVPIGQSQKVQKYKSQVVRSIITNNWKTPQRSFVRAIHQPSKK
jgi:hypothetical protein